MEWFETYAEKVGVKVNKNEEVVELVLYGLNKNKEKFGARYCPCRLNYEKDTVCPCKEMRETKQCHCLLFVEAINGR